MTVHIVIVAYNCTDLVSKCVESLSNLIYKDFVVHVVENGIKSSFEKLSTCAAFANVRDVEASINIDRTSAVKQGILAKGGNTVTLYHATSNLGYSGAINCVLRVLNPTIITGVWILNPDLEVEPLSLSAVVLTSKEPETGLVACVIADTRSGRVQMYGGAWRPWFGRSRLVGLGDEVGTRVEVEQVQCELDFVSGAALFACPGFLRTAGLMDERYFLYCEEVDWCLRRGFWKIRFTADAIVYHDHGAVIGSSTNRAHQSSLAVYLGERNNILLLKKFKPNSWPIGAVGSLLFMAKYATSGSTANLATALRGWYAGLRGEIGPPHRL
ncbi:hypothetical protein SAMN02799631_06330 [Methylobacterium sp. 174MFSha1.1]|uniref:glycosyltransferase n=1 Tax=Methylobacterium sp. 174MFSha1.1 TaxID=1502749 RepID=UPI0008EB2F78|nr:glycosyltransferase family 2 protein [Methylobacterium sp. 174MFSha1.1]SFV16205.1 hypothetical protein SAMN02799631_06330 [Methylobacterium sp. 174MFSha1.1]